MRMMILTLFSLYLLFHISFTSYFYSFILHENDVSPTHSSYFCSFVLYENDVSHTCSFYFYSFVLCENNDSHTIFFVFVVSHILLLLSVALYFMRTMFLTPCFSHLFLVHTTLMGLKKAKVREYFRGI